MKDSKCFMSQPVKEKATTNILQDEKSFELSFDLSLGFQLIEISGKIRMEHRITDISIKGA